jgi:hypothetical protein
MRHSLVIAFVRKHRGSFDGPHVPILDLRAFVWVNPCHLARLFAIENHIESQPDATIGSIEATSGRFRNRDLFTVSRLVCVDAK